MRFPCRVPILLASLAMSFFSHLCHADTTDPFELRDGDTVAFLGDSITAAQNYTRIVENYVLLRYPDRRISIVNAGKGGDTAATGLKRLERDVFSRNATVAVVIFGINDIGWGARADEEHKRLHLESVRAIVEQCKTRGIRVYICTAPVTGTNPDKSENDFLQRMGDEAMALSRSLGEEAIDVQRTMRGIQRKVRDANAQTTDPKARTSMHAEDGIHLNDLGQLAMGFAILKGLGAPDTVSSVILDASRATLTAADGCTVTQVRSDGRRVEFVREDQGLPLNLGLFGHVSERFVPMRSELNRYMLAVRNLPEGDYMVEADDRRIGTWSAAKLSEGVNIGSATPDPWDPGGPWDAQASVVRSLTDARAELWTARRVTDAYLASTLTSAPIHEHARQIDREITDLQRVAARPRPYRFTIRPAEGDRLR